MLIYTCMYVCMYVCSFFFTPNIPHRRLVVCRALLPCPKPCGEQVSRTYDMAREKHRIIDSPFGEVMLKNEGTDNQGYPWCEMYIGDNFDQFVADICCSMDDDIEVILEQIDEVLNY